VLKGDVKLQLTCIRWGSDPPTERETSSGDGMLDFENFHLLAMPAVAKACCCQLLYVCLQVYRRMMRCCTELGCHTQVSNCGALIWFCVVRPSFRLSGRFCYHDIS